MSPISSSLLILLSCLTCLQAKPSFANGLKIGEVTATEARVWVRLSSASSADPTSPQAAAPGMLGLVELRYWPKKDSTQITTLARKAVSGRQDYTRQILLTKLLPGTEYHLEANAFTLENKQSDQLLATFKTAPLPDQAAEITALVVTCQGHETTDDPQKGHWSYQHMLTHQPDFFIHTGDVVYYDKPAAHPLSKTIRTARQRWNRMFSYEWNRSFHNQVTSYFMKDDHDTLKNDCWPGQTYGDLTFEDGLALFKEQTPQGPLPYRNFRWGKDLEIWLMEGRDYRSPNKAPDGPDKTILGSAQKTWLKESLAASDATFKLTVFPSPVVGPDKKGKRDNHSNKNFTHEGNELRDFLASIPNTYVVCGDRHWQYASKDPRTGLVEICSGPINNAHALIGGNAQKTDRHLYFGGEKGGYLRIDVSRPDNIPQIQFTWHGDQSTNGAPNHQLTFPAR